MTGGKSTQSPPLDPVYKNAVREALFILIIFALALAYTVIVCVSFGYDREIKSIETYWGIPDWIWWGILFPWTVCTGLTVWFCLYYLKDDDLGAELTDEIPVGAGADPNDGRE